MTRHGYSNRRGFGHYRDPLIPIAVIGILISIAIPVISGIRDTYRLIEAYKKATPYAEKMFGDKKPPLTEQEREEFDSYMGIESSSWFNASDRLEKVNGFLEEVADSE
jgi:hypothetical protein